MKACSSIPLCDLVSLFPWHGINCQHNTDKSFSCHPSHEKALEVCHQIRPEKLDKITEDIRNKNRQLLPNKTQPRMTWMFGNWKTTKLFICIVCESCFIVWCETTLSSIQFLCVDAIHFKSSRYKKTREKEDNGYNLLSLSVNINEHLLCPFPHFKIPIFLFVVFHCLK